MSGSSSQPNWARPTDICTGALGLRDGRFLHGRCGVRPTEPHRPPARARAPVGRRARAEALHRVRTNSLVRRTGASADCPLTCSPVPPFVPPPDRPLPRACALPCTPHLPSMPSPHQNTCLPDASPTGCPRAPTPQVVDGDATQVYVLWDDDTCTRMKHATVPKYLVWAAPSPPRSPRDLSAEAAHRDAHVGATSPPVSSPATRGHLPPFVARPPKDHTHPPPSHSCANAPTLHPALPPFLPPAPAPSGGI